MPSKQAAIDIKWSRYTRMLEAQIIEQQKQLIELRQIAISSRNATLDDAAEQVYKIWHPSVSGKYVADAILSLKNEKA